MKTRIEKLQKKLIEEKLDALLITNPFNIRYLTGFVGVNPMERESYVVVTKKNIYLLTSALYSQWLNNSIKKNGSIASLLYCLEINYDNKLSKRLLEIAQKEKLKTIGFEKNDVTIVEFEKLTSLSHPEFISGSQKKEIPKQVRNDNIIQLIPTENLVEELRMMKDADEIANIRNAAKLTDDTFSFIVSYLRDVRDLSKLSESQLAWEIEKYIRENGGELAFSPIVAFGENAAIPHYFPSSTQRCTLNASRFILIDMGARVNGYCSDMTRMIFVGLPTEKQKKVYNTVLQAQQQSLSLLQKAPRSRPGLEVTASGKKLDETVRAYFQKNKLTPYPHSLGHGIGLEIHEGFRLSYKKDFTLKPNMVFTIEPGYYETGWGGIRIEDLVLLTQNGVEILSKTTKEIIII